MNKITQTLILPFIIGSATLLTGCGGGGSSSTETDTSPVSTLSSYFFAGTTQESGTEIWKSDGTEAGTVQVKEINDYAGSDPYNYTQVGAKVFFLAITRSSSTDLWVTDVNGTRLVKAINPTGNSGIQSLTAHGNELFFMANDGINGYELWKSDGTDAGTIMVKDISIGASSTFPRQLISAGSVLYFTNSNYTQLWKSDGTDAGTIQVNTTKIFNSYGIGKLTYAGTKLYFIGINSTSGTELWTSDGTDAGTVLVKDIQVGVANGLNYSYSYLYNVNGKLFFSAYSGVIGEGKTLWVSDGTEIGTTQVLDSLDAVLSMYNYSSYAKVTGNYLYYKNASYLDWKTDGTPAGTASTNIPYSNIFGTVNNMTLYRNGSTLTVTDNVNSGTSLAVPGISSCKTSIDNAICFFSTSGGYLVWQTDGTIAGTIEITSAVDSGKGYFINPNVFPVSGGFYYSDLDSNNGLEPWFSDGTANGTAMLTDIVTTTIGSSNPYSAVAMGGIQYFIADDRTHGESLWRTDGTETGTYLVKDIRTNSDDSLGSIVAMGNKLFFSARDNNHGQELWISDGTESGTNMLFDLDNGSSGSYPYNLTVAGNKVYWEAENFVWVTDGTLLGTNIVSTIEPDNGFTVSGENVYFIDNNDDGLWVTSGTFGSTHLVKSSNSSSSNGYPEILNGDNGSMYYTNEDEDGHYQLWITNGTDAGTLQLTSEVYGVDINSYVIINNTLYFSMYDDVNGTELWKSDGTVAGTTIVKDINIGNNDSDPSSLYAMNSIVYFTANDGISGNDELWKSDGTTAGTVKVTDVLNDRTNFLNFYNHNNKVYFSVMNIDVPELWVSDGTVAGTIMLSQYDLNAVNNSYNFSSFGTSLFFNVRTANEGKELWVTDGTVTGTHIVKDINAGANDGANSIQGGSGNNCEC